MSDILETIDNALDDWTVSGDAMRWTGDPPPAPKFPPPRMAQFNISIDLRAFREAMAKIAEAMGPMVRAVAKFQRDLDRMAAREAARRHQPVALCIDGHEYHRRRKDRR